MMEDASGSWIDGWFECRLRPQYFQVDPQGVVHHAVYLQYFEYVRTEMLRALGMPYARLEEEGMRFVVVESRARHRAPARYDEVLRLRVRAGSMSRVRLGLEYRIFREGADVLVCEGETLLVSTDLAAKPCAMPRELVQRIEERRGPTEG